MNEQKPIKELLNFSVINIDKPSGPTSFQISQYVMRSLNLSKTSHMGTLDPQVTGVLPITLGRACKLSEYFMHKDKEYVGVMRVHSNISISSVEEEIKKFLGKIKQLPPVRSRVKRAERVREIKSFKLLEKRDKDILFITNVEAGTYIRKLIHDLGEKIGGAHMLELRRTKAGVFTEESIINLYDFDKIIKDEEKLQDILIPAEEAIKRVLPFYQISEKNLKQILTGKPLVEADLPELPRQEVFAAFLKERFIGVYRKTEEEGLFAKAEFVFN